MDLVTALSRSFDHAHGVISAIRAEQLTNPTPCTEWDVQALLDHTIEVVADIGIAIRGESPSADGTEFALADDAAARFRSLADATLAIWNRVDLDSEVDIGAGPMPARAALSINVLDTSTHAWDIAHATGQPEELPEDLAAFLLAMSEGFVTEDIRKLEGFYPPVSVAGNASPTTKLVAFLGRTP